MTFPPPVCLLGKRLVIYLDLTSTSYMVNVHRLCDGLDQNILFLEFPLLFRLSMMFVTCLVCSMINFLFSGTPLLRYPHTHIHSFIRTKLREEQIQGLLTVLFKIQYRTVGPTGRQIRLNIILNRIFNKVYKFNQNGSN